jgi:hypothetical protein
MSSRSKQHAGKKIITRQLRPQNCEQPDESLIMHWHEQPDESLIMHWHTKQQQARVKKKILSS